MLIFSEDSNLEKLSLVVIIIKGSPREHPVVVVMEGNQSPK